MIQYGGDYNPEQWPLATRIEDVELMQQAGVTLVSVGIFSWAQLEPREGEFDFGWLDDILDRLHAAGIKVTLATATASPPPWLTRKHPEFLPVLADGTVLHPGGRQAYRVSSPAYREYVLRMTRTMAERYGDAPGAGALARGQRAGLPRPARLLRRRRGRVPALARGPVRHGRGAQRRLGHGVLVAAVRRLRRGAAPAQRPDVPEPDAAAGLRAVLLGRAAGALPRAAGRAARGHAERADDHQPHALHGHEVDGLLLLGRRPRRHRQRPLHARPRPGGPRRARVQRRPHARGGRRRPVDAHGALDERGELAAAQPHQASGRDAPALAGARGPRRRRGDVLPVAPVRRGGGEVPLGDAAARGDGHRRVAEHGRARVGADGPERGRGQPRPRAGGDRLRLPGLVGHRARQPPVGRGHLPGPRPRALPRAVAAERHGGHRAAVGGPVGVLAGRRAGALPGDRRRRVEHRPGRRARCVGAGHVLLGHRRRARPHPPRRLPGRLPGAAGGAHRGVLGAAGRRDADPRRRHARRRLVGADAPRAGHVGGPHVRRRRPRRLARPHAATRRRGSRLVPGHASRRRRAAGRDGRADRGGGSDAGARRGRGRPPGRRRRPLVAVRPQPHDRRGQGPGDRATSSSATSLRRARSSSRLVRSPWCARADHRGDAEGSRACGPVRASPGPAPATARGPRSRRRPRRARRRSTARPRAPRGPAAPRP